MKKDYHVHAQILRDSMRAEQFIQNAIARGFGEICITDHMPVSVSSASDRIPSGMVKDYCEGVRALARKFEDRISVRLGIEIDYHPSLTAEIEDVLGQGDFDYVLGSSHLHIFKGVYVSESVSRNQYAAAMLENTVRAAESGYFSAIAHMDMYRWIFTWSGARPQLIDDGFSEERHADAIEAALRAIRDGGLYLEINPHFAQSSKQLANTYPSPTILQKALEMGVRMSYGSDAHHPEDVGVLWDELVCHPIYGHALAQWKETSVGDNT